MPVFHEAQPAGPRVRAHASVAVELEWVLLTAHTTGGAGSSDVEAMYRQEPDLAEAVRGLWGADERLSYPGYLELSVLAERAGLLFSTDSDELLACLDRAARAAGPELPFLSETPEDRVRLHRRLEILHRSAARRRRYVEVVGQAWARVRSDWERSGLPVVEATVAEINAQLGKGKSWDQFVDGHCFPSGDVVSGLGPDDELAIVPGWFTHRGMMVDLPGVVVLGIRTDLGAAGSRARTESLSRQLKVISDPTRLAILDALGREEMTVTELASRFSLAQPTVSNHVKLLRDGGMVAETRSASRRVLAVDRAAIDEVIGTLRDLLGSPPSLTGRP